MLVCLKAFPTNSVDSDLGPQCLSLYLTLLNDFSSRRQIQTEFLDDYFACVLRVKHPLPK